MTTFVTKDSGERRDFGTGSVRDTNAGKPRYDLLPYAALTRWADLMARGALKYGERNWEIGQSMSRFEESALRHLIQYLELAHGETDDAELAAEDHLAAVLFNVGGIIHHEAAIAAGRLPASLDDRRPAAASKPRPLGWGDRVRILAPAPNVEDTTERYVGDTGVVADIQLGNEFGEEVLVELSDDDSWWWRAADLERIS